MRLIKIYIENFGKLHDFDMDFSRGINLISHDNGWGKSTLMAFIKSMFYGLSLTGTRDMRNERKRFVPWQGGAFGGFLTFETNGKIYTINRIFDASKNNHDTFELRDESTGLVTDEYSEHLGEELFGIDSDSFSRSAYIGQNDMSCGVTDSINAKITNLTDDTNDINNYENAIESIKKKLNALSPATSRGSIHAENIRINELEAAVRSEDAIEEALNRTQYLREKVRTERQAISKENELLNETIMSISHYSDIKSNKEGHKLLADNYNKCRDALDAASEAFPTGVPNPSELQRAIDVAAEYEQKKAVLTSKKAPSAPVLGIILVVLGIIAIIADLLFKPLALLILGALFIIAGAILIIVASRKKSAYNMERNAVQALKKEAEDFITGLGIKPSEGLSKQLHEISEHLMTYNTAVKALDTSRRQLAGYEYAYGTDYLEVDIPESATGDIAPLSAKLRDNIDKMRDSDLRIGEYEEQIESLQEQLDEIAAQKSELAELKEKVQADTARYLHLEKASSYLIEAKNNITSKYVDPIKRNFDKYYKIAFGSSYNAFHIDAQTQVTYDEKGGRRDTESLSRGQKDVVSFFLRLALIDAMYDGERPPIILDDPFVNLSPRNEEGCRKVLEELSKRNQILMFTCKE